MTSKKQLDVFCDENQARYAGHIKKDKFPFYLDGLTKALRRFILVGNTLKPAPFTTLTTTFLGRIKEYHPKGDTTIYQSIVRLSQDFNQKPSLLTLSGANGSYFSQKAPDQRYTSFTRNELTHDLFFANVEISTLPSKFGEGFNLEPAYIVGCIPTSICIGGLTVGFGEQSNEIPRSWQLIGELTIDYIKSRKKGVSNSFNFQKYFDKLLPEFPVDNRITNLEEIRKQYKNLDYSSVVHVEGIYEIKPDRIIIHTVKYGKKPIVNQLIQEIIIRAKNKKEEKTELDKFIEDSILAPSQHNNKVELILNKNRNPFLVFDKIKRILSVVGTFHPNCQMIDFSDNLSKFSMNELFNIWYIRRKRLVASTVQQKIAIIDQRRQKIKAELKIVDYTDEAINIIKNNKIEDAREKLRDRFEFTKAQAIYITKLPLSIISKSSEKALVEKLEKVNHEFNEAIKESENIDDLMIEHTSNFLKKYKSKLEPSPYTRSVEKYIGCIFFPDYNANIQISSSEEFEKILKDFKNNKVVFIPRIYPDIYKSSVDFEGNLRKNLEKTNLSPKSNMGNILYLPSKVAYTTVIRKDDAFAVKTLENVKEKNVKVFYTSSKVLAIFSDGRIARDHISKIVSIRKSISSGAKSKLIYICDDPGKEPIYFVTSSLKDKNIIGLHKITERSTRLKVIPSKNIFVEQILSGKNIPFTVKEECLNRLKVRGVIFKNIEDIFGDKDFVSIDLNKPSSIGKKIELLK